MQNFAYRKIDQESSSVAPIAGLYKRFFRGYPILTLIFNIKLEFECKKAWSLLLYAGKYLCIATTVPASLAWATFRVAVFLD